MKTYGRMWIGQGKPTMAGSFRFVQQISMFLSCRFYGLVRLTHNFPELFPRINLGMFSNF